MTAKTNEPGGVTIARDGMKFTISWKITAKDYDDGQHLEYALIPTKKKLKALKKASDPYDLQTAGTGSPAWHKLSVGKSTTKKTLTLSASSFYPTAKKPYLIAIVFRLTGKRKPWDDEKKTTKSGKTTITRTRYEYRWSDYTYKTFEINAPDPPKVKVSWNDTYINRSTATWDCGKEAKHAPFSRVEYQTITKEKYTGALKKIPGWKNQTITTSGSASGSTHQDEADLADKILTRAYRFRAIGPGGKSAWAYGAHRFAEPYAATNLECNATRDEDKDVYDLDLSWTAATTSARPIDKTSAEYLVAVPGEDLSVPAGASWTPLNDTKDTKGANAFSFEVPITLSTDECLWARVITYHDNHAKPSEPALAAIGRLAPPTITNFVADSTTHRMTIAINPATQVPGAFHAIEYRPGPSDPEKYKGTVIGIIPDGQTSITVQGPADWTEPGVAIYAVVAPNYNGFQDQEGVWNYTLVEKMTSVKVENDGSVPQAPTNITAEQINQSGTVQVTWQVRWNQAIGAEISWADHADAWYSTDKPQTYETEPHQESKLNIHDLELG